MENIIWKQINGFEKYSISQIGIKNNKTGRLLRSWAGIYTHYVLRNNEKKSMTRMFHRLLAIHFIPNPYNLPEVNHINANKKDNRIENLEWVTMQRNRDHAVEMGLFIRKLTREQLIDVIKEYYTTDITKKEISKKYGISLHHFKDIIRGKARENISIAELKTKFGNKISSSERQKKISDSDLVKMITEYRTTKIMRKDISAKYGISVETFKSILYGKARKKVMSSILNS